MWSRALSCALAGILLGVPAPAFSASECGTTAGLGIGLVDVRTSQKDNPRARAYIVEHVAAGATLQRRIRVCNGTPSPITVQLYPGAAVIRDGAFTAVEGRVSNELASWTSVAPGSLTLAPGQAETAEVQVDVPPDASDGERYAVVLAELPARDQGGVSVASRVGIRLYISVGDGPAPTSDFAIRSLQAARLPDRTPVVQAQVANTGDLALDLRGELRLIDGPGGVSAGPFPIELGRTLLSGDVLPVEVRLDPELPAGPWTAQISVKSGLLERRAEARITFPDEAGTANAPVEARNLALRENPNVLIPIAAGLIGLIALLLLLALLRGGLRRAGRGQQPAAG